jgi:hypothetical protein
VLLDVAGSSPWTLTWTTSDQEGRRSRIWTQGWSVRPAAWSALAPAPDRARAARAAKGARSHGPVDPHRLDIVTRANRVVYFDGHVVRAATHQTLLETSAGYPDLTRFAHR